MLFGWFDAKEESRFGAALADFVFQRLPPGPEARKARLAEKKAQELFAKLFSQVERFRHGRKLNIYKKARLGNAFKWKMTDLGYEVDFADELTKEILFRL